MQHLIDSFQECYGCKLPTHKIVCPDCDGEGKYVNRALSVITQSDREDWADDDFMEGYMRGDYDVVCETCHERNVIDEVNEDALDPDVLTDWQNWLKDYYETEAIYRMERAMGA